MTLPQRRSRKWVFVGAALACLSPVIALAQSKDEDSRAEESDALETKNIFGFTSGTDIGPEHDREIELETDLAFGKKIGAYNIGEQKATFEYNPTDSLEIDTGVHASFVHIHGVDGMDDRAGANFGGLESRFSFVLIHRTPATPVGLTVSVEPEWSRIDDGGRIDTAFSAETRIIVDTELVPATLYAAVNAIYRPQVDRSFTTSTWSPSDNFGVAGALAYRLDPQLARGAKQVVLGAELEYFRSYGGLGLGGFNGDALFFGPTFYVHANDTLFVAGSISTQVAGRASGDPNLFDLTHFSRNKAQVTIGIDF